MIRTKAKKVVDKVLLRLYHSNHKKEATNFLKKIEAQKGKTNPKFIKLSNQYAADVFGWVGYSPWLYVYSAISGSFKEGWIPDNYYGKVVVPALKGQYGDLDDLNALQNKIFASKLFPDRAYYVNGLWTTADYAVIPQKKVAEFLFKTSPKIVYKTDNSLRGLGVHFFSKDNFEINKVMALGNGIAQQYIKQHAFFNEIVSGSVATIRLTTYIDEDGEVSLRSGFLRLGRTTDTHVKSLTHLRVPLNTETGEICKIGYDTNMHTIEKHPDSNYVFNKSIIPHFNKCIASVTNLHKLMPFSRTIGWDLIVDENTEVKIMEWNGGHNDIKFGEATQGPCYADLGWENLWKK
ncbi:sugar-transfer associated ATP-grasp domain-containing protein [Gelatiniphilus marinus]|uniref:Sugar-transfer associated ATP-grasp domain-containing protein n=1 Tax=Gelatiniphilus marinus TaxID=1759464 RepID=A0ABW5JU59_9FLAO